MLRSSLVAVALVALASGRARAIDDLSTARGLALGSSSVASATGALGPLLNPAGMVLSKQISAEVSYGYTVQGSGSGLHLSLVDGLTNAHLAAGLYYSYVNASPHLVFPASGSGITQASREGHEWGTSLAIPIGERFSLGLTGKYVRVATEVGDPSTPGKTRVLDTSTANAAADGFTIDIGMILRLGEKLNFGIAGYNLIPLHSIEAPIGLNAGLAYLLGAQLNATFNVRIDFDKYRTRGGTDEQGMHIQGDRRTTVRLGGALEYIAGNVVPLRVGFMHDTGTPSSYLSFGAGYQGKTFAFDLGFRQKVNGGGESMLIAGIRLNGGE